MADISDVNVTVIKALYQRLETLDCKTIESASWHCPLTRSSSNHDAGPILSTSVDRTQLSTPLGDLRDTIVTSHNRKRTFNSAKNAFDSRGGSITLRWEKQIGIAEE